MSTRPEKAFDEGDQSEPLDLLSTTDDHLVLRTSEDAPPPTSMVYDIIHRPVALANTCMWDQMRSFERVTQRSALQSRAGNKKVKYSKENRKRSLYTLPQN